MLKLLLTCEHGGNQIPSEYASLFSGEEPILATHKGYDIGALELFNRMQEVADHHYHSEVSRLLVELNRSINHHNLLSGFTKALTPKEKEKLLDTYYFPYRHKVEKKVDKLASAGRKVLHIAVHTFTPVLDGEERQTDIGLLYDPKRKQEQEICKVWRSKMLEKDSNLQVRFNYPYLGVADGLPTALRRQFGEDEYLGIELEVNQKFALGDQQVWQQLQETITSALREVLKPLRVDNEYSELF
ncbi:N-formylglutamate amidohydrolase [Pontibacter arcticus]|uniref:N-formylglutamate amidohydrolase n=1 Tax=Pontibacter arcticus TaxID=2080288 RepID=A0A364RFY9_9BACT|nr:N-formylglutamate amidohydrolase [Pontibacter arcticus]RAU83194.1 N-formylglutamate amidohydrolase [Pontibacter arcticus]